MHGHNLSEQLYGNAGLADADLATPPHSPLLRYRRDETDRLLTSLAAAHRGSMTTVEYRNPLNGAPVAPTCTCAMHRLVPRTRTPTNRKTGSSIWLVYDGNGRSVVNGIAYDWGAGDVFVTPSWAAVDHEAFEPSDLFSISDRPILQAVALYREETLDEQQQIEEVFELR